VVVAVSVMGNVAVMASVVSDMAVATSVAPLDIDSLG